MIRPAVRLALHLYPTSFRRAYGNDMVALVDDQLRDEPTARVVARFVLDLVTTVPAQHLEVRMHRSSATPLVIGFVVVAATLTVIGGPAGLVVASALLLAATLTWRRSRPVAPPSASWAKLLLGGIGLLVALVVVTTATGELPQGGWFVAMAVLLTSFALIGAGIVLGITRRLHPLR